MRRRIGSARFRASGKLRGRGWRRLLAGRGQRGTGCSARSPRGAAGAVRDEHRGRVVGRPRPVTDLLAQAFTRAGPTVIYGLRADGDAPRGGPRLASRYESRCRRLVEASRACGIGVCNDWCCPWWSRTGSHRMARSWGTARCRGDLGCAGTDVGTVPFDALGRARRRPRPAGPGSQPEGGRSRAGAAGRQAYGRSMEGEGAQQGPERAAAGGPAAGRPP